MKSIFVVAFVLVSGIARADYMSVQCDPSYSFGKTDKWALSVDGTNVRLKGVTDWKSGNNVKGLIATEVTKKAGYRQFFFDCKGSCWSAEKAKLNVYVVGTGNGREKIDGPVSCDVSVD